MIKLRKKSEMVSLHTCQLQQENAAVRIMGLTKTQMRTPTLPLASADAVKCLDFLFGGS